jgi:uncharacterized repeat protein (TIGR04076 family)
MFKVRCKLIAFEGDEVKFPCHFGYKIGDEFYYDGVYFTGRICPGLFASMMPIIHGTFLQGNKYSESIMYLYRGYDARDDSMAKYDGVGFRPVAKLPEGYAEKFRKVFRRNPKTDRINGGHFVCTDTRTVAHFTCEAVDLSDSYYALPFYLRELAILGKIEKEAGIRKDELLSRFTEFERDEISPKLTPILLEVLLDALVDMSYVDLREGKLYATGREPPSRPQVG